ncbi:hypothetical protein BX661DRAFT_25234 [Kickxella alabastrina]|uniref:uncharacterized protein n=1 Tax=Kickxella alabastrina TaxID=61397 RepID=UPI0022202B37|nr:uncharacterized protein BX661DRAFT_25234 [Kickxella alabastrina]KAI7827276.1 hypothetical protein BX661DRAFT_25234 [Kickxella alabastrina]
MLWHAATQHEWHKELHSITRNLSMPASIPVTLRPHNLADRAVAETQQHIKVSYPILIDENIKNTGIYKDPTQPLQTLFERGYTLNILLNNLESPFVATIDLAASNQMDLFWRGCLDAGLVNAEAVTSYDRLELTLCTVARMLDILEHRGLLGSVDPRYISPHSIYPQVLDHKSRAAELARTEAAYVHDLERLAGFLHHADVFYGHVQELASLHRAFSMRIQYMAAQPVSAQLFDTAFNGLEEAFEVYSRFCAELARSSVARSVQTSAPC